MATHKPTAPAVPAAPTAIPPAADTGAGTSGQAGLLEQLTGDGTGDASPPVPDSPATPITELLPFTPAAKPAPGSTDFGIETATEDELDAHLRILEKKDRIRKLTSGEQPAAPAPAAIAPASAPVPVTIVASPAAATFTAPSAPLIGKYDTATGLVQQLPQKLWDQLSPEDQKRFSDEPVQPDKPASLV